jgi:ribosome-binding protein aMBF1 (putative translation factor)
MQGYSRIFARAAEIVGDEHRLAEHLKVDSDDLTRWSSGSALPPAQVFLQLAEILKQELMKGCDSKPARR